MAFYIILFVIIIFIACKFPDNKGAGMFAMALLLFFAAFRGDAVGTDTLNYLSGVGLTRSTNSHDVMNRPEWLYLYLINYFDAHGISFRYLIIIFSCVTIGSVYYASRKSNLSLSIACLVFLLLFYLSMFNIARQLTAISLLLVGYTFLKDDKKPYRFLLFVVLATLFHASSLMAILALPLKYISLNKNLLTWLAIFLFVYNALFPIHFVEDIASRFADNQYALRYAEVMQTTDRTFIGLITEFLKFCIVIFVFHSIKSRKTNFSDNLFYASIIAQILVANMDSIVARMAMIFTIYQVYYLTYYFQQKDKSIAKSIVWLSFIVYNAFFALHGASLGYGNIVPYYLEFNFN